MLQQKFSLVLLLLSSNPITSLLGYFHCNSIKREIISKLKQTVLLNMKRKILIKDNFLNVSSLNDAGGFLDRLCKDIFR